MDKWLKGCLFSVKINDVDGLCVFCVSKFESMILLYILRAVETLFMSKDSFLVSGFVLPF